MRFTRRLPHGGRRDFFMADCEFLASEETLDGFLLGFRTGTLPKGAFGHAAHVATAACYCLQFDEAECLDHFRRDLKRFNESVGGENTEDSGYHETITIFWLDTIRDLLRDKALPRLEAVRLTVAEYAGQLGLAQAHYNFDLVKSREARARWIPPNSRPRA
jgi:hypothetical protein